MKIPTIGHVDAFAMIVDINGFTAMVRRAQTQDSIAEYVRNCLSLSAECVEEEGGEVIAFMGDAFLGILPNAESTVLACFAVAHALDQQCEWISNIQNESKDSWPCSPDGPSLKIAIEYGRLDASTIASRKLGTQPFLIGDAINYATRILKAPIKGNRCVVGPAATKAGFTEYNMDGPHKLPGRPKHGEPKYEYCRFPIGDVWREGPRKRGDSSYWG